MSAVAIAAKVEAFVRDIVAPYERDPRCGAHGPSDDLVAELRAKARAAGVLTPHILADGTLILSDRALGGYQVLPGAVELLAELDRRGMRAAAGITLVARNHIADERLHVRGDRGGAHRGAIRIAPSSRMTSPLSIGLVTIVSTSAAYSSGRPSRLGCGTWVPSDSCAAAGNPISIGVRKMPGAIVITRIRCWARSRASGNVMPTTPPFDAA